MHCFVKRGIESLFDSLYFLLHGIFGNAFSHTAFSLVSGLYLQFENPLLRNDFAMQFFQSLLIASPAVPTGLQYISASIIQTLAITALFSALCIIILHALKLPGQLLPNG